MVTTHRQPGEIYYPEEDGKLTESDKHYTQGMQLVSALRLFFAERSDVFVGGNIALLYKEGDPTKYYGPDVLVAFGVRPRSPEERGSYRLWEEGVPPVVIFELTSTATRQIDTVRKPRQYAALGVREYFLFDPRSEFLNPRLQGYRLNAQGRYDRLVGAELDSQELGLRLIIQDGWLRLFDPITGVVLPTDEERKAALEHERAARAAAEAQAAAERAARAVAEAQVERLQAELARLRNESGAN